MKATVRRNGSKMVTVKVAHHLSLEDIGEILASYQSAYGFEGKLIKTKAEEIIRDQLRNYGGDITWTWNDKDMDGGSIEEARAWGHEQAERLFGSVFATTKNS